MRERCSQCQGNKTYRGMGSMIIKCTPCKGTGFVDVVEKSEATDLSPPAKKVRKDKGNAKEKTGTEIGS